MPTLDEFIEKNLGAWSNLVTKPAIAFEDFRRDPEEHPLETPSGKIEIFSAQLYDFGNPDEVPPIPKYIQEWESPFDACHCEERPEQRRGFGAEVEGQRRSNLPSQGKSQLTGIPDPEEIASGKERPRNDSGQRPLIHHNYRQDNKENK